MTSAIQRQERRGTKADTDGFVGAEGEVTVDLTNNRTVVHDGSKQGGFSVPNGIDLMTRAMTEVAASGTDNYVATFPSFPDTYIAGMRVSIKFTNANTGNCTININGVGVVDLLDTEGNAIAASELEALSVWEIEYNGAAWQLYEGAGSGSAPAPEIFTASGSWVKPSGFSGYIKVTAISGGGGGSGGGGNDATNGTDGGTTAFGTQCSATGGGRGTAGSSGSAGSDGVGVDGDLNITTSDFYTDYSTGGKGGSKGSVQISFVGQDGGDGVGVVKYIDATTLPASVSVTVGAAGARGLAGNGGGHGTAGQAGVCIVEYL